MIYESGGYEDLPAAEVLRIKKVAKEFAKHWIDKSAKIARENRSLRVRELRILELKEDIDLQ